MVYMELRMTNCSPYVAETSLENSLRAAFSCLKPKLRPPFPLNIMSPEEYKEMNRAILYGVLCEPGITEVHMKHLHGIITDGYEYFTGVLTKVVNEIYDKLVGDLKKQLLRITHEMIYVSAVGVDGLLVGLMRQIVSGDYGEDNLWLCYEIINIFSSKWDCLLELEEPLVFSGALYVFLRLLADHFRLRNDPKINSLMKMEIAFCVRMFKEKFSLCLSIGRDVIRLLQDLVKIPEFQEIWKNLLYNPRAFGIDGFVEISQIYSTRTSRWYFSLRLTPQMESQLRFLLSNVKFGSQKRYQVWFVKKFLATPERSVVMIDIVRFICCAHYPSNYIINSDILPRWALIGWLLLHDPRLHVQANLKLALFYDWLFFDEKVDNIMNIEPAILLMVNSIPDYAHITHTLLEFLILLAEHYDPDRKPVFRQGILTALLTLVRKRVIQSLDILLKCDKISPLLRDRFGKLLSDDPHIG